jgi:signal recognition particle subunit SRP54
MTKEEKKNPDILKASRKLRIAKGSGTEVADVNKLLKQFDQMKQMMKMFSSGKMPSMPQMPKNNFPGMGGKKGNGRFF